MPDSTLVRLVEVGNPQSHKAALIEFKTYDTLIYSDRFFRSIQKAYGDRQPPLLERQDIFGVERDALLLYQRLTDIDVKVIVVGWHSPREDLEDGMRAQYTQNIVVCNEHTPSDQGRGSGTPMANTHFGSLQPIAQFFVQEFGIAPQVFDYVFRVFRRQ